MVLNMGHIPLCLFIIFYLGCPIQATAHPGRTDIYGGHVDKETGIYHFHDKTGNALKPDTGILHIFFGIVTSVSDGDTLTIKEGNLPIKIRLNGIDCPEKQQAFGDKARKFTADACFGKMIRAEVYDVDQYGRMVSNVILADGNSLNSQLVAYGLAWQYAEYSSDINLAALERQARDMRIGLWIDTAPIPPWDFRKQIKDHDK